MSGPNASAPALRAYLLLVVLVLSSGIAGAAIDRALARRSAAAFPPPPWAGGPPLRPPGDRRRFSEQIANDLGLSPDQKQRIDASIERRFAAMQAVGAQVRPQLDSLMRAGQAEIDAILTDSQRARVRKMRESAGAPPMMPPMMAPMMAPMMPPRSP